MSERAFLPERSAPSAHRAAERRNTGAPGGTERRNDTGTVSLKALAEQVLSRGRTGTPSGTLAEHAVPLPPERPVCPHVTDPDLAEWYAENPRVTCARCWLARRGKPLEGYSRSKERRPSDG